MGKFEQTLFCVIRSFYEFSFPEVFSNIEFTRAGVLEMMNNISKQSRYKLKVHQVQKIIGFLFYDDAKKTKQNAKKDCAEIDYLFADDNKANEQQDDAKTAKTEF
jgi:hypothetical protein